MENRNTFFYHFNQYLKTEILTSYKLFHLCVDQLFTLFFFVMWICWCWMTCCAYIPIGPSCFLITTNSVKQWNHCWRAENNKTRSDFAKWKQHCNCKCLTEKFIYSLSWVWVAFCCRISQLSTLTERKQYTSPIQKVGPHALFSLLCTVNAHRITRVNFVYF